MARTRRWDPCVSHRAGAVEGFIAEYFAGPDRSVLFVGGAGFDPRSTAVAQRIAAVAPALRAVLLQENRPRPPQGLVERATDNTRRLTQTLAGAVVEPIEIFGPDGAVVGGRNAVAVIARQDFDDLTDVVVDSSALAYWIPVQILEAEVDLVARDSGFATAPGLGA